MKERDIAIAAIKEEARKKPKEKVIVGTRVYTFEELSKKIDNGDKTVFKFFVKPYEKLLKESKPFKAKVMDMLGLQ